MPLRGVGGWFRYGVPGLVPGFEALASWGLEGRGPSVWAQNPPASASPTPGDRARASSPVESSGTIAFTSSAGGNAQLLYLIDTKTRAFALYRVDPSNPKGVVKLEAARQYQWDLRLAEYNNLPPEVAAIESTVKSSLGQPNR